MSTQHIEQKKLLEEAHVGILKAKAEILEAKMQIIKMKTAALRARAQTLKNLALISHV